MEISLNKKEQFDLKDCVVYLLQYCSRLESSDCLAERKCCLDVAKKALFLYNLYPKALGRNKKEKLCSLKYIIERIEKYSSNKEFHS
jgi:hypothetical protein